MGITWQNLCSVHRMEVFCPVLQISAVSVNNSHVARSRSWLWNNPHPTCSRVGAWGPFSQWSRAEIGHKHIQRGWNLMQNKYACVCVYIHMVVTATRLINGLGWFWRLLSWQKRWMAFRPAWMKLGGNNKGTSPGQTQPPAAFPGAAHRTFRWGEKTPHTRIYVYF